MVVTKDKVCIYHIPRNTKVGVFLKGGDLQFARLPDVVDKYEDELFGKYTTDRGRGQKEILIFTMDTDDRCNGFQVYKEDITIFLSNRNELPLGD